MNLKYNWRLWKTFYIVNYRYMVQSLNKLEIKINVDWSRLCSSVSNLFFSKQFPFPVIFDFNRSHTNSNNKGIMVIIFEELLVPIWRWLRQFNWWRWPEPVKPLISTTVVKSPVGAGNSTKTIPYSQSSALQNRMEYNMARCCW